ncbi:uncharacterized protein LOC116301264 [Actinia tenebrosa]|uniref:Uncharacterized protein LOC116301264 n=1 Tax=Actinia tenebrosa TaxID=6105 RepID=A0A6P8IHA3_ACTTE|nr:uncharacterized protein LOC116301264 [Actinia tenebrosa]
MVGAYGLTCVFTLYILIAVLFIVDDGAEGLTLRVPHGKLEALLGRKCLNLLFREPCVDNQHCNISLEVKLESKTGQMTSSTSKSIESSQIMKINSTSMYLLCMFDSSAGENVSCCNDISHSPGINITNGVEVGLSHYQEISFDLKACNESCLTLLKFFNAFLPWHDPCYFGKPCQNLGTCQPAFNSYTCLCRGNWNGTNCTIPKDMTYNAGQCLNYLSSADVKLYMKTVEECRSACLNQFSPRCKAFQFKQIMSGNYGNCTLRNSNSLEQKVQSCDMDLYEFTNLLIPPTPESHSAPTAVATVTLNLLLAFLAFFLA